MVDKQSKKEIEITVGEYHLTRSSSKYIGRVWVRETPGGIYDSGVSGSGTTEVSRCSSTAK